MSTITVLGGPDSGKTTYLGCLCSLLQDDEDTRFSMNTLPEDASALENLEAPLLDGRYPKRTAFEVQQHLELHLSTRSPLPARDITLNVSDYAGEQVERLFSKRAQGWSDEWVARAGATGILLFIRPESWMPLPKLIPPVQREPGAMPAASRAFAEAGAMPMGDVPSTPLAESDESVRLPTELAVIELLQFLRHVRGLAPAERPPLGTLRVAVVVATWDALDEAWQQAGPRKYVKECASLLEQYLWSNFLDDDVRYFALSSTGGDLKDEQYRARYMARDAHGYVKWHEPAGKLKESEDITMPVAWALFGDDAIS